MNEYHGDIHDLSGLEDFCVLHSSHGKLQNVDSILPTASARSLTPLSIILDASETIWPSRFLDFFPDLTSLSLWDGPPDICQLVGGSSFHFTEFRIRTHRNRHGLSRGNALRSEFSEATSFSNHGQRRFHAELNPASKLYPTYSGYH